MERKITYFLFITLVLWACSSTKEVTKPEVVNLSKMYNPVNTKLHPAFSVYNDSPSTSVLMVKIFPVELLYSGTIEPGKLIGKVGINYKLYDISNADQPQLADSGKLTYIFLKENADKRFQTQIILKTLTEKHYQLKISLTDMVRRTDHLFYLYIDKSDPQSEQSFFVTTGKERNPLFKPYVISNSLIKIDYSEGDKYDSIFVKYYSKETSLPKSTLYLSTEKRFFEKPDSIWIMPLNKAISYQFNYKGIYYLQPDTNREGGLTLMNFGDKYPRVQEIDQLVESLAYLATSNELNEINNAVNRKLAFDNFWLKKCGNIEKARELIRVYYNRVYFANYYFTSYKPGWKTDRGMIFIIYGPPQDVKVTSTQEKWIYYKNNFNTTVTFVFNHTPLPFSPDNFSLQRSDSFDTYWRNAIDTWRKGDIYLIE